MAVSTNDVKDMLKRFWHLLDTGNARALADFPFAKTYTYNGQPSSGEITAAGMAAGFDTLSYHRFYVLDIIAEQQGDVIKGVVRCLFIGVNAKTQQKVRSMATNTLTISAATGEILTNWQVGAVKGADFREVDYFLPIDGVMDITGGASA